MKIIATDGETNWEDFEKEAWREADVEHYGRPLNWQTLNYTLTAYDELDKPMGRLRMKIEVGVCCIDALVVSKTAQGKGVGTSLLAEAEKIAQRQGAHKIYLQTGKKWRSADFYQKNGYEISAELTNHFDHVDYVELTKFL